MAINKPDNVNNSVSMKKRENNRQRKSHIREKNYEKILNAAEEMFSLYGFKGTSIQAIAEKADLPKANIHYYFSNKKSLYMKVLERILALWNQGLDDLSVAQDPAEVLEHYIAKKVKLACDNPMQSRLFAAEVMSGAPCLEDYIRIEMRQWMHQKVAVFESWMAKGVMRKTDPVNLLFMIWASTQHFADFQTQILLVTNRREYDPVDVEGFVRSVTEVILHGLDLTPSWERA